MEYKVTLGELLRIENEHGIDLSSGEGKEDLIKAYNDMKTFEENIYDPHIKLYNSKETISPQLKSHNNKLNVEYRRLINKVEIERVKYYGMTLNYFCEGVIDTEDLTREQIDIFAIHYEKQMKRTFIIPNKDGDNDGNHETAKKQDRSDGMSLTQSIKRFLHGLKFKK